MRRTPTSLVAAGVVGLAVGLVVFALVRDASDVIEPSMPPEGSPEEAEPETELGRMPLTGVVTDDVPVRPALVVKVSNSPEARPQTGLDVADLVYEELVEGGVTRFLAVFHSRLPDVVGPVRSARPVDTQVMAGFGHPGFAYSGARPEVAAMLEQTPAATITEGDPGFFRDQGEYASHPFAPHDLFLQVDDALATVTSAGARPLGGLGWVFAQDPPADAVDDGGSVEIAMSEAYRTTWQYDVAAGVYRRQQNGRPFTVTGPERIGAANVVVLEVRHFVGDSGYPESDVLGSGDAIVLRDGQRYPARWSKPTATDPLQILTADGLEPFPLRPGPTWLHLPARLPEAPRSD